MSKMYTVLLLICLVAFGTPYCKGKTEKSTDAGVGGELFLIFPNDSYGFINRAGETVIDPGYSAARDFSEGMAAIKTGKKWGFVGLDGNIALTPQYQYVGAFKQGLAPVMENYKYGFIDKKGVWKINPQYDDAGEFNEGFAWVEMGGKYGFIDMVGRWVIKPQFARVDNFSEGLAPVKGDSPKKWGYIDGTGKMAISPAFHFAYPFSEGLAVVENEYGKYGYIDKKGNVILDFNYLSANNFSEGLAAASLEKGKIGYINSKGENVIPPAYTEGTCFSEGLAAVSVGGVYGFIDKQGKTVISPRYMLAFKSFKKGAAFVGIGARGRRAIAAYIDKKGEIIKQWEFDPIEMCKEDVTPVNPDRKYVTPSEFGAAPALKVGDGTGIPAPQLISSKMPDYPKEALEKPLKGEVLLDLELDIYGRVVAMKCIKGALPLKNAAMKAVKHWVYEPTIIDGIPTRVALTVTLRFTPPK
ncbi:MAG: hypothetical protein GY757_49845 [bacterium]|nr:hypothetical protein [bacterium]